MLFLSFALILSLSKSADIVIYQHGSKTIGIRQEKSKFKMDSHPTIFRTQMKDDKMLIIGGNRGFVVLDEKDGMIESPKMIPWEFKNNRNFTDKTGANHFILMNNKLCLSADNSELKGAECNVSENSQIFNVEIFDHDHLADSSLNHNFVHDHDAKTVSYGIPMHNERVEVRPVYTLPVVNSYNDGVHEIVSKRELRTPELKTVETTNNLYTQPILKTVEYVSKSIPCESKMVISKEKSAVVPVPVEVKTVKHISDDLDNISNENSTVKKKPTQKRKSKPKKFSESSNDQSISKSKEPKAKKTSNKVSKAKAKQRRSKKPSTKSKSSKKPVKKNKKPSKKASQKSKNKKKAPNKRYVARAKKVDRNKGDESNESSTYIRSDDRSISNAKNRSDSSVSEMKSNSQNSNYDLSNEYSSREGTRKNYSGSDEYSRRRYSRKGSKRSSDTDSSELSNEDRNESSNSEKDLYKNGRESRYSRSYKKKRSLRQNPAVYKEDDFDHNINKGIKYSTGYDKEYVPKTYEKSFQDGYTGKNKFETNFDIRSDMKDKATKTFNENELLESHKDLISDFTKGIFPKLMNDIGVDINEDDEVNHSDLNLEFHKLKELAKDYVGDNSKNVNSNRNNKNTSSSKVKNSNASEKGTAQKNATDKSKTYTKTQKQSTSGPINCPKGSSKIRIGNENMCAFLVK